MIPWEYLGGSAIPGSRSEITCHRRGTEYSIRVDRWELMNSLSSGSEKALARIAGTRVREREAARVLVGGLGMGFTLAALLDVLSKDASVVVSELLPCVVDWNRGFLSHLAGHPLEDPRVAVEEGDVGALIRDSWSEFDAILLDVDNGPEGFTRDSNDWLYGQAGLAAARQALRPAGVLAVWSAFRDAKFTRRFRAGGFAVEDLRVPARGGGGLHHSIWIGTAR